MKKNSMDWVEHFHKYESQIFLPSGKKTDRASMKFSNSKKKILVSLESFSLWIEQFLPG